MFGRYMMQYKLSNLVLTIQTLCKKKQIQTFEVGYMLKTIQSYTRK